MRIPRNSKGFNSPIGHVDGHPAWEDYVQLISGSISNHGNRFRPQKSIALWDPGTIHGRNLWLINGGDSNHLLSGWW